MHEADDEQHRHPSRVEGDTVMARGGTIHLDREADPEERREDRDELARDEPIHERLGEAVRQPGPHQRRVHVRGKRRVEPAHVGREDAEERGAAQAVDDGDALPGRDRADRVWRGGGLRCGVDVVQEGRRSFLVWRHGGASVGSRRRKRKSSKAAVPTALNRCHSLARAAGELPPAFQ